MPPRRPNAFTQDKDRLELIVTTAIAATGSLALGTMDGDYTVDRFEIIVPGGYTADNTNFYTITLQAAAVVLATITTTITAPGTGNIADLTAPAGVLAASPAGSSGDVLKVVFTKAGTAVNLPVGTRLVAHCHQL
jgi:hypothetical protein